MKNAMIAILITGLFSVTVYAAGGMGEGKGAGGAEKGSAGTGMGMGAGQSTRPHTLMKIFFLYITHAGM